MAIKKNTAKVTQKPKKRVLISYKDELLKTLRKDPEQALLYLNEALKDEDPRIFLLALQDVIDAYYGSMATFTKKTSLSSKDIERVGITMPKLLGALSIQALQFDAKRMH